MTVAFRNIKDWRETTIPISEHFPVYFRKGSHLDVFTGECARCDKDIDSNNLRGDVHYPSETMIQIRALGYCPDCNLLTPFNYDVWDDLHLVGKKDDNIAVWSPKPSLHGNE